jgi:hypothetical protein
MIGLLISLTEFHPHMPRLLDARLRGHDAGEYDYMTRCSGNV